MALHRFYASPESIQGTTLVLDQGESHHLRRVLRLREGDRVVAFDGAGREYLCRIERVGDDRVLLRILKEDQPPVESPLLIRLAQAVIKGEKFDWVVQKATELGVTEIVPLVTDYCDPWVHRWERSDKLLRWQRIALEACKQCGRTRLPQVSDPIPVTEFLMYRSGVTVMAVERGGRPLASLEEAFRYDPPREVNILIGPEGGWSSRERELAQEVGARQVTLGPRVLRTETAGIVVTGIVQYLWGDLSKQGAAA